MKKPLRQAEPAGSRPEQSGVTLQLAVQLNRWPEADAVNISTAVFRDDPARPPEQLAAGVPGLAGFAAIRHNSSHRAEGVLIDFK